MQAGKGGWDVLANILQSAGGVNSADSLYGRQALGEQDLLGALVQMKMRALLEAQNPLNQAEAQYKMARIPYEQGLLRNTERQLGLQGQELGIRQTEQQRAQENLLEERRIAEEQRQYERAAPQRQLEVVERGAARTAGGMQTRQSLAEMLRDKATNRHAELLEKEESLAPGMGESIVRAVTPKFIEDLLYGSRNREREQASIATEEAKLKGLQQAVASAAYRQSPALQSILNVGGPEGYAEVQQARQELGTMGLEKGAFPGLDQAAPAGGSELLQSPEIRAIIEDFKRQYPNLTDEQILQVLLEEVQ